MIPLRVLLVDDHPCTLSALSRLLSEQPDLEVTGQAPDAQAALSIARANRPDVVVLDISLPDGSGADLIAPLRALGVRVLVFSMHSGRGLARAVLRAGAKGFLTKDQPERTLVEAVRAVGAGRGWWTVVPNDPHHPIGRLTERQHDVLGLLARGASNAAIAATLSLSESTVRNVLSAVYRKLGVEDGRQAIAWAQEEGIGRLT